MAIITPNKMIVEDGHPGDPCGPSRKLIIGDAGGLTQFGTFVHILAPGSSSSLKHWHAGEDEMIFVLAGEVTVIEGDVATLLHPGDAATFKAGDAVGHRVENRSGTEVRFLVIGTRIPADTITYPDHGLLLRYDEADPRGSWSDLNGAPARNPYIG
ncbi:cupin domain-containing protein [Lacibacterium aquatile]|uniref:Cupin domain-containing protein n=1 Tax=Lacibacterium aquatile TaxID=1168082 RepID=A0ABW5DP14_9PROT